MQRGTVDGLAFTTIGLPDLGIQRFIRYRIDPSFLQLSICLQINLDTWERLTPAAQQILTEQAIAYESASRKALFALQDREIAQLAAEGLIAVNIEDAYADAYRAFAHDVVWQRFAERVPESAARLQPFFYPAGAAGGFRPPGAN